MSAAFIKSQESLFAEIQLARNPENKGHVYTCEIENVIKIDAGNLPPLEIPSNFGDFVEVFVCHVENPVKFYVHLKGDDIGEMKLKMGSLYAGNAASKLLANPQKGQCCAVKHTDNMWYRAVVIDRKSPTQVEVYFVDYGIREKVLTSSIRELHPECSKLPPQAVECNLQNVDKSVDENLTKKFRDVAQNQKMVIRPEKLDGFALVVSLFKVVGDMDFCINDYLLGKVLLPIPNSSSASRNAPTQSVASVDSQNSQGGGNCRGSGEQGSRGGFRGGGQTGVDNRNSSFGDNQRGSFQSSRGYGGNNRRGGFGDRGGHINSVNTHGFGTGGGGSFGNNDNTKSFGMERGRGGITGVGGTYGSDRNSGPGGFGRGGYSNIGGKGSQGEQADNVPGSSQSTIPKSSVEFRHPILRVGSTLSGNIIQAQSPDDFWITTARSSGFNTLPDEMWQYSKQVGFTSLDDLRIGKCCILLSDPPGEYALYCRAIIANVNDKFCDLFLVDYAETKRSVPITKVFNVPTKFSSLERQAIKCTLAQAEEFRAQFNNENKRKIFVDGVNRVDVHATIKALQSDGMAIVDVLVLFGVNNYNLREICKKIADGDVNVFGEH